MTHPQSMSHPAIDSPTWVWGFQTSTDRAEEQEFPADFHNHSPCPKSRRTTTVTHPHPQDRLCPRPHPMPKVCASSPEHLMLWEENDLSPNEQTAHSSTAITDTLQTEPCGRSEMPPGNVTPTPEDSAAADHPST